MKWGRLWCSLIILWHCPSLGLDHFQSCGHWWVFQLCWHIDSESRSVVHGILQARILERVAVPFSRGSSRPVDWTWVSCISGRFFTIWVTRNATNMWKKKGTLCLEIHELKNTNKTKSREDCFDQRKLLLLMPGLLKATCEKDLLISTWRITS